MIFSYTWLQDYIKEKLPKPSKLAELLSLHIFEVEEVEKRGKDWILDIDVLPNRAPDCFSHLGIAREISAITGLAYRGPSSVIKEEKAIRAKDFVKVEVKDKRACPRYTARVITDVKVGSSPQWIKEKLKVCRLRPINNIVDIANYVMLETGQPLHAFDGEKLKDQKIIVRFAKKNEKVVTLDKEKYVLGRDILVIADAKKPVAIAGIKGGLDAGIDKKTKTIVLESANFDSRVIRGGSRKLNLRTDASIRFEHGIDPNLTEKGINRAAFLIQEIAGGKIAQDLVDFYPKKVLPKKIKLDLNCVEKLLGIKISQRKIKDIFKKLSFKVLKADSKTMVVQIPTLRLDISIPEDLIEEIGRIYGYEKIKSSFPTVSLIPPKRNIEIFWEDICKNILKEMGFTEVYNYSFISEKDAEISDYVRSKRKILLELENPMSKEQKYLRPTLIINLLKNVKDNEKDFEEIKIFELGKIFRKSQLSKKLEKAVKEKKMLTSLITGDEFFQLKGAVDLLLNKLGISNIWYDSYQPSPEESKISFWQPKKCAEIKVDDQEMGFLGEISPKILGAFKISTKVVLFEVDFEKLVNLCSEEHEYQPISRFPAAVRDLAVLVPREVLVEEVLNKIEVSGGPLIRDVDVFDIYEGEELPKGKKNLAFHIIYQAEDRTLSSKEIDKIQRKIIKALEENPEWQVRR